LASPLIETTCSPAITAACLGTATAATATATATVAIATTATTATTAARFPGCGLIDPDHAPHPFNILEVVDRLLLGSIGIQLDEGKAAFAACLAIKREAALANLAILTEKIKQVFPFGLKREIADVNGHQRKNRNGSV